MGPTGRLHGGEPMILNTRQVENFWSKVKKSDGCWPWTGCKGRDGYGLVKINGKMLRASRVALFLYTGEIGAVALHSCRCRECVNPKHLRWGSHTDNMRDKKRDGTASTPRMVAARRANAKLTADNVLDIRKSKGISQRELGRKFGVTQSAISRIQTGDIYSV